MKVDTVANEVYEPANLVASYAHPLSEDERQDMAIASAMKSPVGILLMIITAILGPFYGIVSFLMPIAFLAAVLGGIEWDTFRWVLAWTVFGWVLGQGFVLAMYPYALLIGWLNRGAVRVDVTDGSSRVLGWRGRPFLGLIIALPIALILWWLAGFALRLIAPGI